MFYNYPDQSLGGGKEDRTPDPLLAKQVLSQLSYTPTLSRFGLLALFFSEDSCFQGPQNRTISETLKLPSFYSSPNGLPALRVCCLPRKEVIQPHLPIRLPCYDFTPVIGPAFGSSLLTVGSLTSGVTDSHGVTGGVYKTRERIHRGMLIRDY